ncbi:MAG: hypothetical protein ACXACB_09595 [Promethearchaeota archaeon]|jgi:hypothetical protein
MKDIKQYFWMIPLLGAVTCFIAFITPVASFENRIWNHTIYVWIWGFYFDRLVSVFDQSVSIDTQFYTHPLQITPSLVFSSIIIVCITFVIYSTYKHRKDYKDGKTKAIQSVIPGLIIIICVIIWMVMMEFAELSIYDLSMWNRYIPNFGLIGLYLGAGLMIVGFLLIKKFKLTDASPNN